MRRIISIFVCLTSLLLLIGCGTNVENASKDIVFYYPLHSMSYNENNDVIGSENRFGSGEGSDLQNIVSDYLTGPKSQNLISLFPDNTTLVYMEQLENDLVLTLSESCNEMDKLELILACTCLAKTMFQFTDALNLKITSESGFKNADEIIMFNRNSILTDAELHGID